MRCLIILVAAVALAGCSTTPVPLAEATFIPDQLRFRDADPNTVPVIVRRDRGFAGSGCKARVFVDGDLTGYLGTGEAVALNVPAGDAIVGADPGAICGGGLVEQAVTLMLGKPVYFRVARDQSGTFSLMRTIAR